MAHIHEKIDFTVTALIVNNGQILLRKHEKYGMWLGVGGHIELDEDPLEALAREVKEEAGLDIELIGPKATLFRSGNKDLMPPAFMQRHFTDGRHEHVDLIYVVKTSQDRPNPSPKEQSVEFKWFSREELEDDAWGVPEHIRHYAGKAIGLVG